MRSPVARVFLAVTLPVIAGCAPRQFNGRLILDSESQAQMATDAHCQNAWDVKLYGRPAHACSWTFDDPLHPGNKACHVIYEQPTMASPIYEELKNCATVDQERDP